MKTLTSLAREWGLVLFLLVLTLGAPLLVRWIDPTAGVLDGAFVQLMLYAGLKVAAALVLLWLVINISFRTLDKYIDAGLFRSDFHALPARDRVLVTSATLLVLFVVIALGVFFA